MKLEEWLKRIERRHPEQGDVIRAFAPLALAQAELAEGGAGGTLKPYRVTALPVDTKEALKAAERLTEALAEGFAQNGEEFRKSLKKLAERPSPVKKLCGAVLTGDTEMVRKFAESKGLTVESLSMLLLQTARTMAARASRRVKLPDGVGDARPKDSEDGITQGMKRPVDTMQGQGQDSESHDQKADGRRCPCCGSRADMSVVFEQEGKRFLHCALCGHMWRYSRMACPFCGLERADNLEWIFEDGHPEERAVKCGACQMYLLEVDARPFSLDSPEMAYYATLGMGHLDALAQEEGGLPGTLPPEN